MNLSRPDRLARLDALAAEYALGTLPGRARRRLARVAQTDTVVASAIRGWEHRLSPLADAAPPITPSPRVWRVIALRLGLEPVRTPTPGPWWTRLGFWRGFALASFVAAVALALVTVMPRPEPIAQPIVVVLAGPDAKPALIATMARDDRVMTVKTVDAAPVPPGRSLELWMLPDGAAPRSLGVLPGRPRQDHACRGCPTRRWPACPRSPSASNRRAARPAARRRDRSCIPDASSVSTEAGGIPCGGA